MFYFYKTADGKGYCKFKHPAEDKSLIQITEAEFDAYVAQREAEAALWRSQHNLG